MKASDRDHSPLSAVLEEASGQFVARMSDKWTARDEQDVQARLASDLEFAAAWHALERSWEDLDRVAAVPEVMVLREEALAEARRENARRWLRPRRAGGWRIAAALAGLALCGGIAWQLSPYGDRPDVYRTAIGEQRILELEDRSRLALDAATHVRVRYSSNAREIELVHGQAQFSVARDPARPFKVRVGGRTVVALGTVFTIEYFDEHMRVAMMEGKVAVLPDVHRVPSATRSAAREVAAPMELEAGEELYVGRDGRTRFNARADLQGATAWREGKVVFRSEPLREAARRMNRYSHVQIEIADDELAAREISGVFDAGDTGQFVQALQLYLPLTAVYPDSRTVRLVRR
jgi:transmembrane sensor